MMFKVQPFLDQVKQEYNISYIDTNNVMTKFVRSWLKVEFPAQIPSGWYDTLIHSNLRLFKKFLIIELELDDEWLQIPCGKRKFTEAEANSALAKALLSFSSKRKEQRKYYCKDCDAFHLTSKKYEKINV